MQKILLATLTAVFAFSAATFTSTPADAIGIDMTDKKKQKKPKKPAPQGGK